MLLSTGPTIKHAYETDLVISNPGACCLRQIVTRKQAGGGKVGRLSCLQSTPEPYLWLVLPTLAVYWKYLENWLKILMPELHPKDSELI